MHRGWIKDWRKTVDSPIWAMSPLHYKVWKWILYRVDRKTGVLQTSLGMIADGVQWEEFGVTRIPNRKTISSILQRLEAEKMINRESNRLRTMISVVNWDIYNSNEQEKVTADGQPFGLPSGLPSGQHVQEVHEKLKERTLNTLSADADGSAPLEPSETARRARRLGTPKAPVDPRVSSMPFLKRLEAGGLVIAWGKDGKTVRDILTARLIAGVVDPQAEIVDLWDRFLTLDSSESAEVYTMRNRAHDLPAFRQHLNLLLEQAKENGRVKETALDKAVRGLLKEMKGTP